MKNVILNLVNLQIIFGGNEMSIEYQVWIAIEEWNDENKQDDKEFCQVIKTDSEQIAMSFFDELQKFAFEKLKKPSS